MGGGATLRTVTGAVGAGVGLGAPDPLTITRPTTANLPTLCSSSASASSSSAPSNISFPISAPITRPSCTASSCFCRGEICRGLESVDGGQDKRATGFYYDSVFGPVPSRIEVKNAISALQRLIAHISDMNASDQTTIATGIMQEISSPGTELNWLRSMLSIYDPRIFQSHGYGRVYNALRLLQAEPSVQKMVVSLSSDKAVWDAIMNNEAVRELRLLRCTAEEERPQTSNEEPDLATHILRWILDITKMHVMELIEKFRSLVNEILQPPLSEKPAAAEANDELEEKLRSSVLLAIVILLIVVVTRIQT